LVTASCLSLFFLFYFNRLVATLVSYGLRAYTWHRYRVWIDIQALQLSFLAGRIFFKGFRYHGENETVLIQHGYITWRYWLRSTRQVDLTEEESLKQNARGSPTQGGFNTDPNASPSGVQDEEIGANKKAALSEGRVSINISGLEWFIYNRTPVFDSILCDASSPDLFGQRASPGPPVADSSTSNLQPELKLRHTRSTSKKSSASSFSAPTPTSEKGDGPLRHSEEGNTLTRNETYSSVASEDGTSSPAPTSMHAFLIRLLPLAVECSKGAISLGNENTRAIVVTAFDRASGSIDAASAGPADIFRQMFDFEIDHPVVQMRPNPDFQRSQHAAAERIISATDAAFRRRRWWQRLHLGLRRRRRKLTHSLQRLLPGFSRSRGSLRTASGDEKNAKIYDPFEDYESEDAPPWHGLSRYLDGDEGDDHEGWSHVDYARFSTILDSPAVHLNFFWDVPGVVTEEHVALSGIHHDYSGRSHGHPAPAYGLDLMVRGGNVNYGPWADRLRVEIQNAFFPNSYQPAIPAPALRLGETRQSTVMTIRVDMEKKVSLRVPTRERSKDWQWRGRAHAVRDAAAIRRQREKRHFRFFRSQQTTLGPDVRPFGWMTLEAGADSTVRYDLDMVARGDGYHNQLLLELKNSTATSSVNHAALWSCRCQKVSCNLSKPLDWNAMHSWTFDIKNEAMEMYLLRDHMFLLTDLISDFTAGQKPDYMTFVPFHYQIRLTFDEVKLYLNANDHNIIENPCDSDENAFLILGMQRLDGQVDIPMRHYSPRQSSVKFIAEGHNATLDLTTPSWNTLHTLVDDTSMMTLKLLNLEGEYNYYTTTSLSLTDSLLMTITGLAPRLYLHGFLIRYFMNVKENYFGEAIHFKTLEEYRESLAADDAHLPRATKKTNDLDVILTIRTDKSCVLLPANIYCRRENVRLDVLLIEADMRFTNYYMDLQVQCSPLEASIETNRPGHKYGDVTNCQLYIDGATVYGHRLFGAPPTEPTYACHWDFDVGEITGEVSAKFIRTLIAGIKSFDFTLDDAENVVPGPFKSVVHDVIFLRARLTGIHLWLLSDYSGFLLKTSQADISFNDWTGPRFAKTLTVDIPSLMLAAVELKSAIRHHDNKAGPVTTFACFQSSLRIDKLDKTDSLAHTRMLQQYHVRYHDQQTHRADWLLYRSTRFPATHRPPEWARHPPAMPVPAMPEPIETEETLYFPSGRVQERSAKRPRSGRSRSQSSFLSSSSSISRSKTSTTGLRLQPFVTSDDQRAVRTPLATPPLSLLASGSDAGVKSPSLENLRGDQKSHPALVTFSSPWTPPHFALLEVQPDTQNMPQFPSLSRRPPRRPLGPQKNTAETTTDEFEGTAHSGVFCVLENGISGFCTPSFFMSISELVRELQADHPVDHLDQVQINVISRVMKALKQQTHGQVMDLAIDIPLAHLRLINDFGGQGDNGRQQPPEEQQGDQYVLQLGRTQVNYRSRHAQAERKSTEGQSYSQLAYGSIQSLSLGVSDDAQGTGREAAHAELSLSELGFWYCLQDMVRSRLQLNTIDVIIWAEEVAKTAGLLRRTASLMDKIISSFTGLDQGAKCRHLIYHLTRAGSTMSDPVFLIRPSYVLRSAESHLRLSDSWKIISRLRYIYSTVEKERGEECFAQCGCGKLDLEDPARKEVLDSFEQWRGWDYAKDQEPIMNTLIQSCSRPGADAHNSLPVQAELVMGKVGVVLDPGPRQSDFGLLGINFNIIFIPVATEDADRKLTVQAYLADTSLNLNWALVELAGQVIESNDVRIEGEKGTTTLANPVVMTEKVAKRSELVVVVGTDTASINVTSINLKLKLGAESLRSSVTHSFGGKKGEVTAFTVAADTAMAILSGHSRHLVIWHLRSPKVYGSILPRVTEDSTEINTVRLGAACDKLRFDLKQDIVTALTIVHRVVRDEVAIIYSMVPKNNGDDHEIQMPKDNQGNNASTAKVDLHVAMFLDDYRLNFAVVPSLRYAISGQVARTSIVPHSNGGLEVNFDLKQHEHSFRVPGGEAESQLSVLKMPPINGRLSVLRVAEITFVRARTTVEAINWEAVGVRACFDALNQPGVLHLVQDTKEAAQTVQNSLDLVTGATAAQRKQPQLPSPLVRFAFYGTLAGVKIHFSAPPMREHSGHHADLDFELQATSLRVHNQSQQGRVYERPQFVLNTRGVGLGIFRSTPLDKTNFGQFRMGVKASCTTEVDGKGDQVQVYRACSNHLHVDLFEETVTLVIDMAAFLQDRIKSIKLADEAKNLRPLRRLTMPGFHDRPKSRDEAEPKGEEQGAADSTSSALFTSPLELDLNGILLRWNLTRDSLPSTGRDLEDLIFSVRKVDLRTRQEGTVRLSILDTQLQIVPHSHDPVQRTANSALLPEVVFSTAYFSTTHDRRFAFQAKGKSLDLRLAADFILPASALQKSLTSASTELRNAKAYGAASPATPQSTHVGLLGGKHLTSLLVDADFAGAVVHIAPRTEEGRKSSAFGLLKGKKRSRAGRYSQVVQGDNVAVLQAPGVALKVEYRDHGSHDPTLSTEVKVAASSNTLYPTVVPLILEISSSIQEIMEEKKSADDEAEEDTKKVGGKSSRRTSQTNKNVSDAANDPTTVLGRCKLNAGLWIQRQEFSLSCQPIARVAATARFDDIFVTLNTVQSPEHDHRFFSVITTFNHLQASVQHVYSRESTASFEVESIVMSLINSKHISSTTGISAILNVSPMKTDINAKQLQDFLLFREIWYPEELRGTPKRSAPAASPQETQAYAMQRYQQISASGTLPWHAVVSVQDVKIQVDFGPTLGKCVLTISKLWASSKKTDDSEQNLCIGLDRVGVDSSGRMSGYIELENFRVRTSIRWPVESTAITRAPLVQASIGFEHLRVKAAFDYQPFAVADISSFEFLMYNVRQNAHNGNDRLVGILDGGKVQVFCTAATAAQGLALVQAFERLIQEKREDYETSLHELDRFLRRKSVFPSSNWTGPVEEKKRPEKAPTKKGTFSLHTDVVITLNAVDVGAFPNTFFDNQLLKIEANDVQARFAVVTTEGKTHSGLGMTLGQVRVALSSVNKVNTKALGEVSVPEVIERATTSRGGTILKVPRLVSSMQTWQAADSNVIEHVFRSTFEGKVDVGWNYSRISFIRGMWQTHSDALAQRLGKPLPPPVVKITAEPQGEGENGGQEKITAVVNVPQSKFKYVALEPPIIDTPQLRDMGEATPPLEWIGLQRDKLPEVTHSIIIISLLEVAREVEDAYTRILGSG